MKAAIEIRPARSEDVAEAIALSLSSGPAMLGLIFTTSTKDVKTFLGRAFAGDAGFLGHGVFTAALLVDGRVAGVGAFYSGVELPRLLWRVLKESFSFYGFVEGLGVLVRLLRVARMMPSPARDTHFVTCLGVASQAQGRGVGSALLLHEMAAARARGKRKLALDVALDNPNAERLYARLGFVVVKQRPPPRAYADRIAPLRRMELRL